jgi:hypothetical protein
MASYVRHMDVSTGVDTKNHVLLTLALVGGERSASRPGCLTPEARAEVTGWIADWVGLRAGLDYLKK